MHSVKKVRIISSKHRHIYLKKSLESPRKLWLREDCAQHHAVILMPLQFVIHGAKSKGGKGFWKASGSSDHFTFTRVSSVEWGLENPSRTLLACRLYAIMFLTQRPLISTLVNRLAHFGAGSAGEYIRQPLMQHPARAQ